MNEQIGIKIINLRVAKLSNSPAITYVSRLDLNHSDSQLVSPITYSEIPPATIY